MDYVPGIYYRGGGVRGRGEFVGAVVYRDGGGVGVEVDWDGVGWAGTEL